MQRGTERPNSRTVVLRTPVRRATLHTPVKVLVAKHRDPVGTKRSRKIHVGSDQLPDYVAVCKLSQESERVSLEQRARGPAPHGGIRALEDRDEPLADAVGRGLVAGQVDFGFVIQAVDAPEQCLNALPQSIGCRECRLRHQISVRACKERVRVGHQAGTLGRLQVAESGQAQAPERLVSVHGVWRALVTQWQIAHPTRVERAGSEAVAECPPVFAPDRLARIRHHRDGRFRLGSRLPNPTPQALGDEELVN